MYISNRNYIKYSLGSIEPEEKYLEIRKITDQCISLPWKSFEPAIMSLHC
jgi:hypothetical protein